MKSIFLLILFATTIAARADFVIQQKIESPDQNGIVTLKVKADKTRVDMPTERLGDVSVIQDLNTGDKIMMVHSQKVAKMQPAAEQTGDNGESPALVKTSQKEKVGNYDTEIYTWTNNRGMSGIYWVATDYPDYSKLKALLKKIHDSKAGQMNKGAQPDTCVLPGIVVKSIVKTPTGEITRILISAKEEPVAASDFQIPPDYKVLGLQFGK